MNPRSLEKTLPGARSTHPATLNGYKRAANIAFEGCAYMNIVPDTESSVVGVLIPLEARELDLFVSREKGYAIVDVTHALAQIPSEQTFAFIAPNVPCDLQVPRSYLLTCTAHMSETERNEWISQTIMAGIVEDGAAPVYEFAAD